MARAARKRSESGYYHVVLRGTNKQNLFYDDEDRDVFLNRLEIAKNKIGYKIVAFCLMANHVHLLIKEKKDLGNVIKTILSSYVIWYNSKYERAGHLFHDRYKSEPIENDESIICCTRYILQNPVKAKMIGNLWDYKWSSANLLLNNQDSFVDDEIVKQILQEQTKSFMEEKNKDKFLEWEIRIRLTDEKLKDKILKVLKLNNIYDISQMAKEDREQALRSIMKINGANALQASRITGVPYHFIRYLD